MTCAIHQPVFLPWAGFFYKAMQADKFVFLDDAQFEKGGYQNRARIKTDAGARWLTIPVKTAGRKEQKICDVETMDNRWMDKCINTVAKWYPGVEYFVCVATAINSRRETDKLLSPYTINVTEILLERLGWLDRSSLVCRSSDLGLGNLTATDRLIEICRRVGADTYIAGAGGRKYMEMDKFKQAGIKVLFTEYHTPHYDQRHARGPFIPDLSIIDMLYNAGIEGTKKLIAAGGKITEAK